MSDVKKTGLSVSVIVPAYNAARTVERAVLSVINQSRPPLEIILIDDCSKDNTLEILENLCLRFAEKRILLVKLSANSGPSVARNRGWALAQGDFVAFLDADDVWHSSKLEITMHVAESFPQVSLIGHGVGLIDDLSVQLNNLGFDISRCKRVSFFKMLAKNFACTPAVLVRRNTHHRFNERMRFSEDYELWLKISLSCDVIFYSAALAFLNRPVLSPGGLSDNSFLMRLGECRAYLNVCLQSPVNFILLPFLIAYSFFKYILRVVRM